MKITPFSNVYNRIRKRATHNSLAVYGFSGKSKNFSATKTKIRYFGRNSIDVPLAVKLRVYDKIMKKHKEKNLPSPIPNSPPASPSEEVSRNQIEMSSNMAEVHMELPSPAISVPRPQARKKSRRKTIKSDNELIGSEKTVPKRIHVRGRMRRCQKNGNTSISEKGMLDSGTFHDYFMHLWNGFPEEMVKSVTYFEPWWFDIYATNKQSHKVLNWIKVKGILSKKYVLVPIVLWSHWSLLIFCNLGESLQSKTNGPCMLLLDPLHAIGPNRLEPLIRRFLLDLYNTEERQVSKQEIKKIPFLIPKVPQQIKGDECGYYVLQFVNLFIKGAPETFNISQGCANFMNKDWFTVEDIQSFYKKLDSFNIASSNHDNSTSSDYNGCVELIAGPFDEVSSCVK